VTDGRQAFNPRARAPALELSPGLDRTFKIGLVLKGLDGILEVVGGILPMFFCTGSQPCTSPSA